LPENISSSEEQRIYPPSHSIREERMDIVIGTRSIPPCLEPFLAFYFRGGEIIFEQISGSIRQLLFVLVCSISGKDLWP